VTIDDFGHLPGGTDTETFTREMNSWPVDVIGLNCSVGPKATLETIERAYIMWVLENEGGSKQRTAEVLGIDASTLYRKLSRYGLEK